MKSYTLNDWLKLRNISRPFWYLLKQRGEAPRHFYVGRLIQITEEADAEWIRAREAASSAIAA